MDETDALTGCTPRLETEASRLALLHSLELLDTPAETSYDAITRLAHQLTGRPIALIGLVDADRTWFKSRIGLDAAQSPREISFCHFAIEAEDLFEVPDAHADPRFSVNPLVTGAPHVRYYAGVPLRVAGLPLGTVCVVDHVPHRLNDAERDGLRQLAVLATELMQRRLASRAKSEFIGHMSHEMRTPMNAILGFGQLLQLELDPASRAGQQARHIVDAGRHLLALIDESLDLMRLEAGGATLELGDVDLVPLVAEVGTMVSPLATARGIALQYRLPARLVARADARRARQVLLNLASNAIKYSAEGAVVALSAGGEAQPWVSVRDGGPGLTAEQIGRLFKPFERLGQDHGKVQGSGLGLALSRRLAEAMGGRIDVRSAPGAGSVFTVRWQAAAAPA
jgi:signal transduction histidine kinase